LCPQNLTTLTSWKYGIVSFRKDMSMVFDYKEMHIKIFKLSKGQGAERLQDSEYSITLP
jgi:hypothetical protein